MSARSITLFAAALAAAATTTFAASVKLNFQSDAVNPPASGNPLTINGTTAGVGWTFVAQGTDLFSEPSNNGTYVTYTHNTASPGKTRGATFELTFSKPVYGLTFRVADFGTRSINFSQIGSADTSGGEQTYTVAASNGANAIDLSVANGAPESLITLADQGNVLKATSGVFDCQGANNVGFTRSATYTIPDAVTHVLITTTDQSLTTSILGDNVAFDSVSWPSNQVPEPTTLAALGFAGALLRRSRR